MKTGTARARAAETPPRMPHQPTMVAPRQSILVFARLAMAPVPYTHAKRMRMTQITTAMTASTASGWPSIVLNAWCSAKPTSMNTIAFTKKTAVSQKPFEIRRPAGVASRARTFITKPAVTTATTPLM